MRKKKSTNNKWVTILALVAIIGGGYYWLNTDTTPQSSVLKEYQPDSPQTPQMADSEIPDQKASDSVVIPKDTVKTDVKTVSDDTPKVHRTDPKNAYVDDYGNVIYTQPQKTKNVRYTTHKVGRWGYAVKYPLSLNKESYSQNSDGATFENNRGLKLVTYGGWNIFNESLTELYKKDVPGAKSVTYDRLLRKQRAYVKSGYMNDGQVFYMKEAIIGKDDQEVVVSLLFTYPKAHKDEGDALIDGIFTSFPIIFK